jgi:hypothetical protein
MIQVSQINGDTAITMLIILEKTVVLGISISGKMKGKKKKMHHLRK